MTLTADERVILEATTAVYKAVVVDENDSALAADELTSMVLTLYDKATLAILNSRNAQDILNANDVTIDVAGLLTWTLQPEDNSIVNASLEAGRCERHVALFEWTYNVGAKAGKYELELLVKQLEKVTG